MSGIDEAYRVREGMDLFVIPQFAQDVLGFDPAALQESLETNYPVRGANATIDASVIQWVDGDNAALQRAFTPTEKTPLARRLKTFSKPVSW